MRSEERQIAFLLSRLTWPSAMVRERAAAAIADLVLGPQSNVTMAALLEWISKQRLESVAALGLLPLCRARFLWPELPLASDLRQAVNRPSLLSHLLFEELKLEPESGPPSLARFHSDTAPEGLQAKSFFVDNLDRFLPRMYSHWAEAIEKQFNIEFEKQWAFEWQQLLRAEGMEATFDATHFWGRSEEWHYSAAGFDLKLSEVYRSAYLRAVAWALENGGPDYRSGLFLAAETCPIDLSLWNVLPGKRPAWWPNVKPPSGAVDTVPAQIWEQIKGFWEKQQSADQEESILAAGGRVYEGKVVYDLEILGIFQAAQGPTSADGKRVFDWANDVSVEYSFRPLHFEGTLDGVKPRQPVIRFGDWSVTAASGWANPQPFSRWQYWRHSRRLRLPTLFLSPEHLSFRCRADSVEIEGGGAVVARWRDWTDGLGEMLLANLPPRTGYVMTADPGLVNDFALHTGSKFAWMCRLTGYQRRGSYEKFETFETYQEFGTTGVVMPT